MIESFKIFSVDVAEAEKIERAENEPHFHDFEELFIGIEGKLEHFIDFKKTTFEAPFISFITKGKVHRVQPLPKDDKCNMWVVRFKSEFIPETTFKLYSFYHENANLTMKSGAYFERLVALCEMMHQEKQQPTPDYSIIRHLLNALFSMIESERRKQEPEEDIAYNAQSVTFKSFLKILEENFYRPVGVEFYAEKLFMSSRNLNTICQNIMQQSVSEIIETRKLIEAKNMLTSTDKSISEIGFELGYNEKSYFSNVFKKKAGQTPTAFRERMKKMLS